MYIVPILFSPNTVFFSSPTMKERNVKIMGLRNVKRGMGAPALFLAGGGT